MCIAYNTFITYEQGSSKIIIMRVHQCSLKFISTPQTTQYINSFSLHFFSHIFSDIYGMFSHMYLLILYVNYILYCENRQNAFNAHAPKWTFSKKLFILTLTLETSWVNTFVINIFSSTFRKGCVSCKTVFLFLYNIFVWSTLDHLHERTNTPWFQELFRFDRSWIQKF